MFFQKLLTKNYIRLFAILASAVIFLEQGYASKDEVKNQFVYDTSKSPAKVDKNKSTAIGIIDYEILFNDSNQGKKVIQELKDKYEPLHLELKNRNRDLADAEKKLKKEEASLSRQEIQRESLKLRYDYEILQVDEQIFQNSRVRDEENARFKMQKEIEGVIKIVSESLHLDFVVERSVALYMNAKIDITRDVLRELNKVSK